MKIILLLLFIPVMMFGCIEPTKTITTPADVLTNVSIDTPVDTPVSDITIEKHIIDNISELWACTVRNNTNRPLLVCAALKRWDNQQVIVGEREILPGEVRAFASSFIDPAPSFEWTAEITAFVVDEPLKKEEVQMKLFAKR